MKKLLLLGLIVLFTTQATAQVTKEVNIPEYGKLKSQISGSEAKMVECLIVAGL